MIFKTLFFWRSPLISSFFTPLCPRNYHGLLICAGFTLFWFSTGCPWTFVSSVKMKILVQLTDDNVNPVQNRNLYMEYRSNLSKCHVSFPIVHHFNFMSPDRVFGKLKLLSLHTFQNSKRSFQPTQKLNNITTVSVRSVKLICKYGMFKIIIFRCFGT